MLFHRIVVVDDATGRGIPCVELRTTDSRIFYTDSAGVVAFGEPDLIGKRVFFHVKSFGYTYPINPLGQQGRDFWMTPGGTTVIEMTRRNVAQRLYRVTGSGIYRDSVLLGDPVPPNHEDHGNPEEMPLTGMDTVHTVPYRGKLFWIWGDTSISANPLGNFKTTGARSELPGRGGLDPRVGVLLDYFRIPEWPHVKSMVEHEGQPVWIGGLRVGLDEAGEERLFAGYTLVDRRMRREEHGLVEFDDEDEVFRVVDIYPNDAIFSPSSMDHAFPHEDNGQAYFYHSLTFPDIRTRADAASIRDLSTYEAFTCLVPGSRFDGSPGQLERDEAGNLVWDWKLDTAPLHQRHMRTLLQAGHIAEEELRYRLVDVETTRSLIPQSGSTFWNEYRSRWISIRSEAFGQDSYLGEVWYFEGDTPLGPWVYGRKIVTHGMGTGGEDQLTWRRQERDTYSFYNPTQHPAFDQDGGRVIFFEGTYTASFSGALFATPAYDYNQIMYLLELDDPRLFLPVPVYRVKDAPNAGAIYRTKTDIPEGCIDVAKVFFAPDRQREGTIPVYEVRNRANASPRLTTDAGRGRRQAAIAFYAVPLDRDDVPSTTPLYEYTNSDGSRVYSTDETMHEDGYIRSAQPVCRVWVDPIRLDPLRKTLNPAVRSY